jgi:Icc-related predicted phosphoesterase
MATLLILGDIHGATERLAQALQLVADRRFDLALLAGDVGIDLPWLEPARHTRRATHDASVERVLRTVGDSTGAPVVFVPGNHDLPDPLQVAGAINVDRRIVEAAGLRVVGLGGAGPARFGFPYEWDETEAGARLERVFAAPEDEPAPIDLFLSHTPPAGSTLDPTVHGQHVGSLSVDSWIERAGPRLFVCGHIHEAWGVELRHGVPCINAGALGEPYGQVLAWTVEWTDGPTRVTSHRREENTKTITKDWPLQPA